MRKRYVKMTERKNGMQWEYMYKKNNNKGNERMLS